MWVGCDVGASEEGLLSFYRGGERGPSQLVRKYKKFGCRIKICMRKNLVSHLGYSQSCSHLPFLGCGFSHLLN